MESKAAHSKSRVRCLAKDFATESRAGVERNYHVTMFIYLNIASTSLRARPLFSYLLACHFGFFLTNGHDRSHVTLFARQPEEVSERVSFGHP
jgi:hypothetical protein